MRINLGKGSEKIHAAYRVPDLVAGESVADEHGLQAGFAVFAGGARRESRTGLGWIGVLQPLALADGIVGKHDESIAGEGCGDGRIGQLPAWGMARTHEDRGALAARRRAIGNVEQRRDEEVGLAFEDDFTDAKAFGLHLADEFGVQRGALGQSTDERENLRAHFGLASQSLNTRVNSSHCGSAVGFVLRRDAVEVLIEFQPAQVGRVFSTAVWRGRCGLRCCGMRRGDLCGGKS
jgi:hypothetical protein